MNYNTGQTRYKYSCAIFSSSELVYLFKLGVFCSLATITLSSEASEFKRLNIFSSEENSQKEKYIHQDTFALSKDKRELTTVIYDTPLVLESSEDQTTGPFLPENSEEDSDHEVYYRYELADNDLSGQEGEKKLGLWQRFKQNVALTWESQTRDFYLPVNTWHNRLFYDDDDIDRYNEFPVGAGYGISRYDEDGDWHALYALGFSDSNYEFEPFFGYGYEKQWGNRNGFHYGLGFTAAITAREEMSYIPIPVVLPLASISYKRLSVQSSYIPGGSSNGNVLFTWIRFQLTSNK